MTLGLQVQIVVSASYFPHKSDSRVYIKLSGNWTKEYTPLYSSSNPSSKVNVLCSQLHRMVLKNKVSCK
jgi:hypothetical protein